MSTIELPELEPETVCWHCYGSGKDKMLSPCEFCEGSGYQVTVDGKKVLEFLARHWPVTR